MTDFPKPQFLASPKTAKLNVVEPPFGPQDSETPEIQSTPALLASESRVMNGGPSSAGGDHHPKPDIVEPVVRAVVVSGGAARDVLIVVPRTAAQHQPLIIVGFENLTPILGIIRIILIQAARPFPNITA